MKREAVVAELEPLLMKLTDLALTAKQRMAEFAAFVAASVRRVWEGRRRMFRGSRSTQQQVPDNPWGYPDAGYW